MLNEDEFRTWCAKQRLQQRTIEEITRIRGSDPSRHVASHGGNVTGSFPSKKMGFMVQFESHKNELPFEYLFENDISVLEYWDQPPAIKIYFTRNDGRNTSVYHHPDFFVIREDSAGWEEIKTKEELGKLSKEYPDRYVLAPTGEWHDLAGENYAAPLGLYYKVRSSSEINWTLHRNLKFLYDYLCSPIEVSNDDISFVKALVYGVNEIKLSELIDAIKPRYPDAIYMMILNQDIFVDLQKEALAEASAVSVFPDKESCTNWRSRQERPVEIKCNSMVLWNGKYYKIISVGNDNVCIEDQQESGRVVSIKLVNFLDFLKNRELFVETVADTSETLKVIKAASPKTIEKGNILYPKIVQLLNGARVGKIDRTTYRHLNKFLIAQATHGNGYIGVLDQNHLKGNRTPRLSSEVTKIMKEVIDELDLQNKKEVHAKVYKDLCSRLEAKNLIPPSIVTFYKAIHNIPTHTSVREREGQKAAYQYEPEYLELTFTTPRHGDRPFEIAHIDHTLLDMEFIESDFGVMIERLWLTLMLDAYSRRILGLYLSYDPPSYRSLMMVTRDCVRRFGRLPEIVVHDGGKEFKSIYFEGLIARYSCTKKSRPTRKGRYGNVLERLFGTANTQLLYGLSGNTQPTKNVRTMTKEFDPKKNAAWPLDRFYDRLEEWAFQIYDNKNHEALGQSPRQAFEHRLAVTGYRANRIVPYDEEFVIVTCPAPPKATSRVRPGKGVKINGFYYNCEAFRSGNVEGKSFYVRYDPENMGKAYVYINRKWEECRSINYSLLCGKSEKYVKIACILYRKLAATRRENIRYSKEEAVFFMSVRNEDKLLVQQRKDAAMAPKISDATKSVSEDQSLWKPRTKETLEDF